MPFFGIGFGGRLWPDEVDEWDGEAVKKNGKLEPQELPSRVPKQMVGGERKIVEDERILGQTVEKGPELPVVAEQKRKMHPAIAGMQTRGKDPHRQREPA